MKHICACFCKWLTKNTPSTEKARKARPDAEYTVHVRFTLLNLKRSTMIRIFFMTSEGKYLPPHGLPPALGNQSAP